MACSVALHPTETLLRLTGRSIDRRTIQRARNGEVTPHPDTQQLLRLAVVRYVDGGGEMTVEAIERLDPRAIAREIRDHAALAEPRISLVEAWQNVAEAYAVAMRAALSRLGLEK